MTRASLILGLLVSVAFNLGFVGTIGYRLCAKRFGIACQIPAAGEAPARLQPVSRRLKKELEPLRVKQAADTRLLAELMAASEPDIAEIECTLDRLATTGRSIHGLVVKGVLSEKEQLPQRERAVFCTAIQRQLCEPWEGCEITSCAPTPCGEKPKEVPIDEAKPDSGGPGDISGVVPGRHGVPSGRQM